MKSRGVTITSPRWCHFVEPSFYVRRPRVPEMSGKASDINDPVVLVERVAYGTERILELESAPIPHCYPPLLAGSLDGWRHRLAGRGLQPGGARSARASLRQRHPCSSPTRHSDEDQTVSTSAASGGDDPRTAAGCCVGLVTVH